MYENIRYSSDYGRLNEAPSKSGKKGTKENYLEFYNVKVGRTGYLDWLSSELKKDGSYDQGYKNPSQILKTYRSKESVTQEVLESFDGKPVSIRHPLEGHFTGDDDLEKVGTMTGVAFLQPSVDYPGEFDFIVPKITIWNRKAITLYKKGMRQLSIGYFYERPVQWVSGKDYHCTEVLTWINHVAMVEEGRAGPGCRLNNKSVGNIMEHDFGIALKRMQEEQSGVVSLLRGNSKNIEEVCKTVSSLSETLSSLVSKVNEKFEKDEKEKEVDRENEKKKADEEAANKEARKNDMFFTPDNLGEMMRSAKVERFVAWGKGDGWVNIQNDIKVKNIYRDVSEERKDEIKAHVEGIGRGNSAPTLENKSAAYIPNFMGG